MKLLFGAKYPEVFVYTDEQKTDRIRRLMKSEEGTVLLLCVAESIDAMQEYADDPSIIQNPQTAAHANGGVYALRGLFRKLEAMANAPVIDKPKK